MPTNPGNTRNRPRNSVDLTGLSGRVIGRPSGRTVGDLFGGEMPDGFTGGKTRWNFMKNRPAMRLGGGDWTGGAREGGFSVNPYQNTNRNRPGGLADTTSSTNTAPPPAPPASVIAPTPYGSPFMKKAMGT